MRRLALGGFHSVALCDDGAVYSWGQGKQGQLGRGSTADSDEPALVNVVSDAAYKTISVACGFFHSIAVCASTTSCASAKAIGVLPNVATFVDGRRSKAANAIGPNHSNECRGNAMFAHRAAATWPRVLGLTGTASHSCAAHRSQSGSRSVDCL